MLRTPLALALLASSTFTQSIVPGSPTDPMAEAQRLFAATDGGIVTSTAVLAPATGTCGGATPEETQWGVTRGFRWVNGFALSTGWAANGDEESPPSIMVDDPTSCADANGQVGDTFFTPCTSTDPILRAGLTAMPFTSEAAAYIVNFDLPTSAEIDVAYNFVTYEDPTDMQFRDAFGIFLDGQLLAGGTTNTGADPMGDSWTLQASQTLPAHEYNSMPAFAVWQVPAYETGERKVRVALAAGSHQLEYRLADSRTTENGQGCDQADDFVVDSLLFGGMVTYRSEAPGAHTVGMTIGSRGHATTTGGNFGDDLQITLSGAPPGWFLFLFQSPSDFAGTSMPLFSPLQLVVGLSPLQLLGTSVATGGVEVFPPTPPTIPATVSGTFHYQWWAYTQMGAFQNSEGLRLTF